MKPETKSIALQLKAEDEGPEGSFLATFSTLNVLDHHRDVTVPGAFQNGAKAFVGAYQHDLWSLPVGKGEIHADEERAWIDGQFNLKATAGRDTYEVVKDAGDLMEWSYVFIPTEWRVGDFEDENGQKIEDVRFLEKIDVWSVDPVLKGAGIDTRTDEIKSRSIRDEGALALDAVEAFCDRVEKRAAWRAEDGRDIGADTKAEVDELVRRLDDLKARLADALTAKAGEINPAEADELERMALAFRRTEARLAGVGL